MNHQDLTIKAIGRNAQLGSLYDAYNEKFVKGLTLINITELPANTVTSTDISRTVYKYIYTDSLNEKFENLEIQAELKASIMAGLLEIGGSAKYMSNAKQTHNSVKCTFIYNIRTKSEEISFSNELLKKNINFDTFKTAMQSNATHVVCGIDWGASSYATFEKKIDNEEKNSEIRGDLKISFEKIPKFGGFKMNDDDIKKFNQFSLHFEADCVPNNVMLPTTVEEMIPFMSNMQKFIEKDNNGKGTQIQYYLFPLSKVKEIMSFEISTNKIISLIEISTINKLEEEFDNFEKQKQKFYQLEESFESLSLFLPEEKSNQLKSKKKEIEQTELNFKSKIKFFYLLKLFEYF